MPAEARPRASAEEIAHPVGSRAGIRHLSGKTGSAGGLHRPGHPAAHQARDDQAAQVLGAYTQVLPEQLELYMDNVKDTYHASLLHLFFTRFA